MNALSAAAVKHLKICKKFCKKKNKQTSILQKLIVLPKIGKTKRNAERQLSASISVGILDLYFIFPRWMDHNHPTATFQRNCWQRAKGFRKIRRLFCSRSIPCYSSAVA